MIFWLHRGKNGEKLIANDEWIDMFSLNKMQIIFQGGHVDTIISFDRK